MNPPQESEPGRAELQESIKRRIVERTDGRIHDLEVEVTEEVIVIRGQTSSFYIKQLAIEGTLDVIGTDATRRICAYVQVQDNSNQPKPLPT
jgi:hypothetical protein